MPPAEDLLPVHVVTGFLGSGKTTLLKRLLADAAFADSAVLINELGSVSLDHLLIDYVEQETIVLKNGCICCGVHSDMRTALAGLLDRRDRGLVPPFRRVFIETTGMADPTPVLNTLTVDDMLVHHFRLGAVVATVDAVAGLRQLSNYPESAKQAIVADRLIVTKADLAEPDRVDALVAALRALNRTALLEVPLHGPDPGGLRLDEDIASPGRAREILRWLPADDAPGDGYLRPRPANRHASRFRTVTLTFDAPLDWTVLGTWLSMLQYRYGDTLLRIKGLLNIAGADRPTVLHGVQHLMHPPAHLDAWPGGDRRSHLVLIGDLPDEQALLASYAEFDSWRG
ncbi:GTP-binding protein [Pigmentiphaga soli]|uniref:GTP-binding protein n=1 Tax=Pigmentiphaga soli TaxID=1007095 RepID=A0ABP8HNR1_9BURK